MSKSSSHQGSNLTNPEIAQVAKSIDLNSYLPWRGPSEPEAPHPRLVLMGWRSLVSPLGSAMACDTAPPRQTERWIPHSTAAVTLSWEWLQSPDCSWNFACPFQLRVFWDPAIDCSCGGIFLKTLLFQPNIKEKKSVKIANVKSRICSFSAVFCLKGITEHFQ